MITCRKWYTHDFLAESQKLLKKAPTSKNAGLTPPTKGMLNISKYPGHLPDFTCYDGNPRNHGLVGVDGAYSSYGSRGRILRKRGQASVPANLSDHPSETIALDMLYTMHFTHLRYHVQALRHVGTKYEHLFWLEHFAVELEAPLVGIPDTYRRPGALAKDMARSNDRG
ncbi:uncharacterized protein TNCV_2000751 [Trichonephila clavipes]|nr:uncharacterized protein TNCV_2000751 [Trichonephila clavipes]